MTRKYTEKEVKAAVFYNGVAGEAKTRNMTPERLYEARYGQGNSLADSLGMTWIKKKPKSETLELFELGREIDKTAALFVSVQLNDTEADLAPWIEMFRQQADSEIVKMELSASFNRVTSGQMLNVGRTVYLAALAHREK